MANKTDLHDSLRQTLAAGQLIKEMSCTLPEPLPVRQNLLWPITANKRNFVLAFTPVRSRILP